MPTGNNSYLSDSDGTFRRQSVGIRDPGETSAVQAKEPDRQSTTRRGSSSRGRMEDDYEDQDKPRSRSQRSSGSRGAQARRATDRGTQARRSGATTSRQKKSRRGFAAMSAEQQREIARKGGLTVSRNRRHMADIGRIGGEHSHGGRRAKTRR